jgi:hypothetical protein
MAHTDADVQFWVELMRVGLQMGIDLETAELL